MPTDDELQEAKEEIMNNQMKTITVEFEFEIPEVINDDHISEWLNDKLFGYGMGKQNPLIDLDIGEVCDSIDFKTA